MVARTKLTTYSDVVNNKRLENSNQLPYDVSGFGYAKASKNKAPYVHPLIAKSNLGINEDGSRNATASYSLMDLSDQEQMQIYKKDLGDTSHPFSAVNTRPLQDNIISSNNEVTDSLGAGYSHPFSQNTDIGGYGGQSTNNTSTSTATDLPNSNVLHDYEPYNYIISMSCLGKETFNSGGTGGETLIFKSGGKGQQGTGFLQYDYYCDSLVVRNSLASNEQTASGSFFQLIMNVTEPFGTSFVDALLQAAGTQGYKDHMKAVYNIRIEFKGYNDIDNEESQPTNNIPFTTRDIPVHIVAVKLKIEAGVSTYELQCIPATMLPLTDLYSTLQASVTCVGDTVGDLVEDFLFKYSQEVASLQTSENQKFKPGKTDLYVLDRAGSMKDLLSSPVNYSETSSLVKMFTVSNLGINQAPPGYARNVTIPLGTKIQSFIEAVVKESRFYRDQFEGNRPILPTLKTLQTFTGLNIGEDNGNGRDQYTFIYTLRTQELTSDILDGSINTSNYLTPVRTYDYIHTGKNKDILDFDVQYNLAYYQASPYFKDDGSYNNITSSADGKTGQGNITGDQTKKSDKEGFATEPQRTGEQGLIEGLTDSNGQIVQIFQDIIQNPSADLLTANLEIIGDPYWMPMKPVTNNSFLNSFTGTPNTDVFGSVATDESQVIIKINFKQPQDLDDKSGLFKNLQDVKGFQGYYRVFLCDHRFESGVYTTLLTAVRVHNQSEVIQQGVSASSKSDDVIKQTEVATAGTPDDGYQSMGRINSNNSGIFDTTNNVKKTTINKELDIINETVISPDDTMSMGSEPDLRNQSVGSWQSRGYQIKKKIKQNESNKLKERLGDAFDPYLGGP